MRTSRKTTLAAALVTAAAIAGVVAGSGSASRTVTDPPRNIAPPTIAGVHVGQTLTANIGNWSGTSPINWYYQWIRSDGGSGTPIAGATGSTYTPTDADVGHNLFVQVKGQNDAGPGWANSLWTSQVTDPIETGAITLVDGRKSIPVDNVTLPNRLVIATADFSPLKISPSGTVTAKVTVVDAFKHPVHGVLVQVIALPFGSIKQPAEVATDNDGIATITLTGMPQLAHTPGGAIALSVRARKSGDNVLAGVTAERLVKLDVQH